MVTRRRLGARDPYRCEREVRVGSLVGTRRAHDLEGGAWRGCMAAIGQIRGGFQAADVRPRIGPGVGVRRGRLDVAIDRTRRRAGRARAAPRRHARADGPSIRAGHPLCARRRSAPGQRHRDDRRQGRVPLRRPRPGRVRGHARRRGLHAARGARVRPRGRRRPPLRRRDRGRGRDAPPRPRAPRRRDGATDPLAVRERLSHRLLPPERPDRPRAPPGPSPGRADLENAGPAPARDLGGRARGRRLRPRDDPRRPHPRRRPSGSAVAPPRVAGPDRGRGRDAGRADPFRAESSSRRWGRRRRSGATARSRSRSRLRTESRSSSPRRATTSGRRPRP